MSALPESHRRQHHGLDTKKRRPLDILSPNNYLESVSLKQLNISEMRSIALSMEDAIAKKIIDGTAYPTFLRPTSKEKIKQQKDSQTFVIEVGGTNMRAKKFKNTSGDISQEGVGHEGKLKKNGRETTIFDSPDDFFDSLFNSMPGLIEEIKTNPDASLSIIFSFEGKPVESDQGLDYIVTRLSKGFKIPGMENNSFITLLNNYLKEKHDIVEPRKMALFNDTVILPKNIGIVHGTGFNYAIKMKVSQLRQILGDDKFAESWKDDEYMIVNIEAANEGIIGKYMGIDKSISILSRVDSNSENQNKAIEEKAISGKYLGESLEIILSDLNRISLGKAVQILDYGTKIDSVDLSNILNDNWESISTFYANPKYRNVIKEIGGVLRDRAAYTLASLLVGGLDFTKSQELEAIVEGSVFWNLPEFKEKVEEGIRLLKGDTFPIEFTNTKDEYDGDKKSASQYFGALAGMQYFSSTSK